MVYNRAKLKRDVKLSMKRTRPGPILVALLYTAVVSAGTWLVNLVLGGPLTGGVRGISETVQYYILQGYELEYAVESAVLDLLAMGTGALFGAIVGSAVLSLFVALWQSTMKVSYEGWCLAMVRNEDPPVGKLFGALPQFGPVLVTRILTGIFEVLWIALVFVGYVAVLVAAVLVDVPVITILLVLADIWALALGVIWVTMRYALVDYVMLDKGLYGMEAIRESKRLMKGNIGRGFTLELSFLGWFLLECVIIYGAAIVALIAILSQLDNMDGLVIAAGVALIVVAAAALAATVLGLWLKSYTTGCWARFYDWASGRLDSFAGGPGYGGADGGWSGPADYTWSTGPTSGTGAGSGPASRTPKPPRDDPWN